MFSLNHFVQVLLCTVLTLTSVETCQHSAELSPITDDLFLSSMSTARDISQLTKWNISAIIDVQYQAASPSVMITYQTHNISYHHVPFEDVESERIEDKCVQVDALLEKLITNEERKVLIHCVMGKSRSVSVAMYWLMKKRTHSNFDETLAFVQSKRKIAHPNLSFQQQLKDMANRHREAPSQALMIYPNFSFSTSI